VASRSLRSQHNSVAQSSPSSLPWLGPDLSSQETLQMTGFVLRAVIAAFGLWLASTWVEGITLRDPMTLLISAFLLGIVNAFVRPIAVVLTFPITMITLGLFLLVVNAGMLLLVAKIIPGFDIAGFWPAFWAAVIISITGWIGSWLIGSKGFDRLKGR